LKDLVELINQKDFKIGMTPIVMDSCKVMIVFNNKLLLLNNLESTLVHVIVKVGSSNLKLVYIETNKILIIDNNSITTTILLSKALYFLNSPANVLSIEKLSEYYRNRAGNNSLCIKLIYNKS
jgi:hypothetical protein